VRPSGKKKVKNSPLPPWLTPEIIQAMALRDQLKKSKQLEEYKKARNKVKNLVRDAKKELFNKLVENSKDTSKLWRALNSLSKKKKKKFLKLYPLMILIPTFYLSLLALHRNIIFLLILMPSQNSFVRVVRRGPIISLSDSSCRHP
jgi:type III secretory pathway component EscR